MTELWVKKCNPRRIKELLKENICIIYSAIGFSLLKWEITGSPTKFHHISTIIVIVTIMRRFEKSRISNISSTLLTVIYCESSRRERPTASVTSLLFTFSCPSFLSFPSFPSSPSSSSCGTARSRGAPSRRATRTAGGSQRAAHAPRAPPPAAGAPSRCGPRPPPARTPCTARVQHSRAQIVKSTGALELWQLSSFSISHARPAAGLAWTARLERVNSMDRDAHSHIWRQYSLRQKC